MTRIAIIADSHFDEHSRFEECRRVHSWIVDDIEERGVDLILHAGDIFERRSTPRERMAVADWLQALANIAPFLAVRGNHDVPGDLELFGSLRSRYPISIEERAGVHDVAGVAVACLAWPRKAQLLAQLAAEGHAQGELAAGDALRAALRGMGQQLAEHEGPRVLLAHAMVRGSQTSTGQPLVGCDLEVGLEDLALAGADFYALGHIHMGQDWTIGTQPAVYPGSPRRTAFGELESKGYLVVDFDTTRGDTPWPRWERIETPATPMLLLYAEWCSEIDTRGHGAPGLCHDGPFPDVKGAEVRLRYGVESDFRAQAASAAAELRDRLLADGAVSVRVEEIVEGATRARVPEIARVHTTAEKLDVLRASKGEELDAARTERLAMKLGQLEQEVREA